MNVADTIMMLEAAIDAIKRLQLQPNTTVASLHFLPAQPVDFMAVPVVATAIKQQNGAVILGVKY